MIVQGGGYACSGMAESHGNVVQVDLSVIYSYNYYYYYYYYYASQYRNEREWIVW